MKKQRGGARLDDAIGGGGDVHPLMVRNAPNGRVGRGGRDLLFLGLFRVLKTLGRRARGPKPKTHPEEIVAKRRDCTAESVTTGRQIHAVGDGIWRV